MFGMFECVNVRMSGPSTYDEASHSKSDSNIPNIRNIRSFPIYCFLKNRIKGGDWREVSDTSRQFWYMA